MLALLVGQQVVFSTCVEVIQRNTPETKTNSGILHVCGGDPHHKT